MNLSLLARLRFPINFLKYNIKLFGKFLRMKKKN